LILPFWYRLNIDVSGELLQPVPAHLGSSTKRAVKRVCVYMCYTLAVCRLTKYARLCLHYLATSTLSPAAALAAAALDADAAADGDDDEDDADAVALLVVGGE